MANSSGLNRTGILSRVTVAAITAALVGTTTAAVAAEAPQPVSSGIARSSNASAFAATSTAAAAPVNYLLGVNSAGTVWAYEPVGGGVIQRLADNSGTGWNYHSRFAQADLDGDGHSDGWYAVRNGRLNFVDTGAPATSAAAGTSTTRSSPPPTRAAARPTTSSRATPTACCGTTSATATAH